MLTAHKSDEHLTSELILANPVTEMLHSHEANEIPHQVYTSSVRCDFYIPPFPNVDKLLSYIL